MRCTVGSHSALLKQGRWSDCQLYYTRLWALSSTSLCTKHWTILQKTRQLMYLFIESMSKRKTRWDTYCIKHLFGMSCRQTESGSGLNDGCGREAHNHNTNVPLKHLTPKCTARENKKDCQNNTMEAKQWQHETLSMLTHPSMLRPLLKQACKTTIWSFQCFLLEAEHLFTKAFVNSVPMWSSSKCSTVLSSDKAERLCVAEAGL